MTRARQALADTLCQGILGGTSFRSTPLRLGASGVPSVVGCACFAACHDGTDRPASASWIGAEGGGTGLPLRGVTSRTSLVKRGSNAPCLRDCSMRLLT
jgi:hypothetical protein